MTRLRPEITADRLVTYEPVSGLAGNLYSSGSDTLASLMTLWSEAFETHYPRTSIQVQAAGSSTAPPALIEGTSNFGPMSRAMTATEVNAFESRYGYEPTPIRIAIDALAIYVHKDNPVRSLSVPQIDAIFSATRRCGEARDITRWGDVGLSGNWAERPIQIYGRNSVSGTYGYFKQVALCGGDFKSAVNEQPGSASVLRALGSSLNGVGYAGIGKASPNVSSIPLRLANGEAIPASRENIVSGRYPLARFLYVYINRRPGAPLPRLEREFIRMVLSAEGQALVARDGYEPITPGLAAEELSKIL